MKRVLIIQQKMIGDVLTSTFLCEVIKSQNSDIVVDYLINEHTLPVVKGNPFIDAILVLKNTDTKNIFSIINFTKKHISNKYDVIIDVYAKLESNVMTLLSNASVTISYKKWHSKLLYNHTIKTDYYENNGALNGRLCLLKPLFEEELVIKKPKIYLSKEEIIQGKQFLIDHKIAAEATIYMISVLGSSMGKTYPLEYMAEVIDTIVRHSGVVILLNYIPSQFQQVKNIYNLCNSVTQKSIRLHAYTRSLRSFLTVLKHCKALIGNEGGAVNMAKGLGIPTFSIYSPQIKKEAWNLFSNSENIGVHLRDYHPELFYKKTDNTHLYKSFHPKLFKEQLINFIQKTSSI